jgi:hypothetical protein
LKKVAADGGLLCVLFVDLDQYSLRFYTPSLLLRLGLRLQRHVDFSQRPCPQQQSTACALPTSEPSSHTLSMIRRNPTLIAISDLDVQDIRQHVLRARDAAQGAAAGAAPADAGTSISADPAAGAQGRPVVAADDAKRKREAMTRDERLGLA